MERVSPPGPSVRRLSWRARRLATRLFAARLFAARFFAFMFAVPLLLLLCATSPPDPTEGLALDDFALRAAASRADARQVAALLAGGADPNTEDGIGVTPLMIAVVGNIDRFRAMIVSGFGNDVDKAARALAKAVNGDIPTVRALLEHGADVNKATYRGITPLSLAVMGGEEMMVKFLVRAGADMNAQAKRGETALMVAAAAGHTRIAKFLVRNGAKTGLKTRDGFTALLIAVATGNWDTWRGIRKAERRREEREAAKKK